MPNEAKHTKGPWHVGLRQAEQIVYDATGWAVANATVYHGKQDLEETKANARLIAAAPALLAALEALVNAGEWEERQGAEAEARAAIAAAKGE